VSLYSRVSSLHIKAEYLFVGRMDFQKQCEIAKKNGRLHVSNMNLRFLPEIPDYVQELYCDNNKLTVLPTLPLTLRGLYCKHNYLQSLPRLPPSLIFLYCSNNKLVSLPSLPKNLRELDCSYNKLYRLPRLPLELHFLHIANNRLRHLPLLPESLPFLQLCECEHFTDVEKFIYMTVHNNSWNPLFERHLAKGLKQGIQSYHLDVNQRLHNLIPLQAINVNNDVLDCIGSFLSGKDGTMANQILFLLAMIE